MYIPPHFAETDPAILESLIETNNFATLVSVVDGEPFATHLPFLYDRNSGALDSHMARSNPHWQSLAGSRDDALVIFQGPHHYVSPSWYGRPGVPTWNYAAVHVYGAFELVEDPEAHEQMLERLTDHFEAEMETPWRADFDSPGVARMRGHTVAFRIRIHRLEGKFKLSQNRERDDRERVIAALEDGGDDDARGVAALMRERR